MHNLPTVQALREALNQPLGTQLKNLLEDRLADMLHCSLQNHTHIVVVEAGDTEEQLRDALGFCPFKQRSKGQPCLEWTERHGGWWELLYCRGDYANIILVEDDVGSPLAGFCRRQEA